MPMFLRSKVLLQCCAAVTILAVLPSVAHADLRASVREATRNFKDITLVCRVTYANVPELKKIGKDFTRTYEFKTTFVRYKAPDKFKIEGKLGMVKAEVVINGDRKATIIPAVHYTKKENIASEPHKRQTDLDIGILSDSLWQDYIVLDTDTETTPSGQVHKIVFVRSNARDEKMICWAEARTYKLLKLEKHNSDGSLKCRFIYSKHSLVDGIIWVPGRVDVYNRDGKLAGTTVYENIRLNTGIPDAEFRI